MGHGSTTDSGKLPSFVAAQIHSALAYYYDHKVEVDAQIAHNAEEYAQLRTEFPNPMSREQFQARWQQRQSGE